MARPILLFLKALAPGERWVTLHPNGPDTKGVPVLIKEEPDGAARVISGAGGSLTHLRLRGVKSESDYKAEAAGKAQSYRDQRKKQAAADKKAGIAKSKAQAHDALKAALGDKRAQVVNQVAAALGWDTSFPEHLYQNLSEAARAKAERKHASTLLRRAKEAIAFQRQQIVADAEARDQAGLGEVPLTSSKPDQISAADLAPVAPASARGLGFSPDYGKRAAAAGLTPKEQHEEARAARGPEEAGQHEARQAQQAEEQRIAAELDTVRDPMPQLDPHQVVDTRKALDLVKAGKALALAEKQAKEEAKKIRTAREPVEPRAYVLETSQVSDEDALKGLETDLKTVRTRAFLSEIGKMGFQRESVGQHIGAGAYNSINALSLAATGGAALDRSVVDVLGVDGAAKVLARRLAADLTPQEMDEMRDAMEQHHVSHYMAAQSTDGALRDARQWHEMAQEIEVDAGATGHDLTIAQELNARRREYVGNAQKVLGTALGEMEANAALVAALGRKKAWNSITVSMGKLAPEQAVAQARAIGLQRGEYRIERVGASTMLTVDSGGMDRLAKPVSRADLQRQRQTMDIITGRRDEEGWLPQGVARRLDLGRDDVQPGVAPSLAQPFRSNPEDVRQAVRDYIGARAADGDTAPDILAGLLNEETVQRAGDRNAFFQAVEEVAPSKDAEGKMVRAEAHADRFAELADDYAKRELGGAIPPLHRQRFDHDDKASEALHRALAETPEGVAAWKQVGDLTPQDQRMLRDVFAREYAQTGGPEMQDKRDRLAELDGAEPEREVDDMFGRGPNPLHADWKQERDGLAEELNRSSMTWGKYLGVMGSPARAYQAMQDVIRSKVVRSFAEGMNRLAPDKPLKIGRAAIRNDLDHLGALDPEARERRADEARKLAGAIQARVGGRFAADDVKGKMLRSREAEAAIAQSQMGLFGAPEPVPKEQSGEAVELPELRPGERYTIGHQAEGDVAKMMGRIGANFRPGTAAQSLWQPTMSGRFVGRQRAVKLIEQNKRVALGLGVGSGKTSIMLSSFAHLKSQGKAKRAIFLVPSVVQGQFHGEALNVLEPGRFQWHARPGASRDERVNAYKNRNLDFVVATHSAFREDVTALAAEQAGTSTHKVSERLAHMAPLERKDYIGQVLAKAGIDADFLGVDEGHALLGREGKADSHMANVLDAVAHNAEWYVNATADTVKNDVSEAFSLLSKMDPDRYADRDAFMRRYGVDTPSARDELQREMSRHLYSDHITPDVQVTKRDVSVTLGKEERDRLELLDDAAARARVARMKGGVDVDAFRVLSPQSFAHVPQEQHEDVARELNKSIGIVHDTAVRHAVSGRAKIDAVLRISAERRDAPGVVFAHSLQRVHQIADALRKQGRHVVVLTGGDSSKAKAQKRDEFQTSKSAPVLVASDAGAVGLNAQRGRWLVQFDQSATAMTHAQRNGRINRIGQKNPIELFDLLADHKSERVARQRLKDKYELRNIMSSPQDGLDDRGLAGMLQRIRADENEARNPLYPKSGSGAAADGAD